jgi:eukaryotic-like serine/threonine-protein kinase
VTACPAVEDLEAGRPSAAVRAHLAACAACRMVAELVDHRSAGLVAKTAGGMDRTPRRPDGLPAVTASGGSGYAVAGECARIEPLLAAADPGQLDDAQAAVLAAHLARCVDCRDLVGSLAPVDGDGGASADHVDLPLVETTAYALGAEVARGGMGRILAARDLRVGRTVAVKELLGRSPQLAARFEREARVTARLQHPGIVPIYEIGQWPDGTPFYSMRLVDGRTLRVALREAKTLDERLALLPAVMAATEAVAFAHSRHVIHRDLTPSNIIVGAYGETVVIDWGLAKDRAEPGEPELPVLSAEESGDELTAAGQIIGTATYMPPEQASGAAVDERADVYALGAILYHVLAGAPPYTGRREEVLRQVTEAAPAPLERAEPRVPRDLTSIVGKAMAREPAQRYATARELAEELSRFRAGRLVEAHAYSRGELWRRWLARHRAAVFAAAAALVAIAIATAVSFTRVVHERDRAETERVSAIAASARLLEEQGRQELLAGNPMRAAAWLAEAYTAGNDSPALRLLLGLALRDVELLDRTVDCGGEVRSLELDPAGTRVVAACEGSARVWSVDGAELATLAAPGLDLANARFSHDGQTILTWGPDGVARLWDATSGALRRSLAHGAHVFNAALAPDDATVVTTGFDGFARIWRAGDGAQTGAIQVSTGLLGVRGTLAPDGKTLVTATSDGHATAWDLATRASIGTIDHGAPIVGGNLSPDGARASTCGRDGVARVWDARSGALLATLAAHSDVVLTCKFSPTGDRLLTTSQDGTAKVWDLASGRVLTSVTVGGVVGDGRFSPDGRRFTTARLDGWLRVHEAATGALVAAEDDPRGTVIHAFSGDGTRLYAARRDGVLRVIELDRVRLVRELAAPDGETVVDASEDGAVLVTQKGDEITAWDVGSGAAVRRGTVRATAWTAVDALAAVGVSRPAAAAAPFTAGVELDAVARVWDDAHRELVAIPTARVAPTLTQNRYAPATGSARLSPAGALVIVSRGVAVWELPREERTAEAVAGVVEARVPWRIADGKLVERTSELRVEGDGVTSARATRVPDMIDGSVVGAAAVPVELAGRGDGSFTSGVPVGRYDVEVARAAGTITRRVTVGPDGARVNL